MRIALINPPLASITQPFLALASLQAHLHRSGFQDVRIHDLSQQAIVRLLNKEHLEQVAVQMEQTIAAIEQQESISLYDAFRLEKAILGHHLAGRASEWITPAVATLRDPHLFYQPELYESAMQVVDQAFEALSAAHFPQLITRSTYVASTMEDLDDMADLAAFLDEPSRCLFYPEYQAGLLEPIATADPKLIGISITFASQFIPALVLARLLRARLPEGHIVLGGAFITARRAEIERRPELFDLADSMIIYEGETALAELAACLEAGRPIDEVSNLMRRVTGRVAAPQRRHVERLEDMPAPDYSGYDIGLYLSPGFDILYDPTRGCHWGKCAFCATSLATRGQAERRRSAQAVADHLQSLAAMHDTKVFSFAVDAVSVAFMRELAAELVRRQAGIKWTSEFTLDRTLDRETLDLFKESGCCLLLFGLESASPRILQRMRKGTRIERTDRILRDCNAAGIPVLVHLMVGFPGETPEELEVTVTFVERLGSVIDVYELSPFSLIDDSPMAHSPDAYGIAAVGPLQRIFSPRAARAWTPAGGGPEADPSRLLGILRARIDRALCLTGRRHLRQDGAHLHLYLAKGGQRPRDFAPLNLERFTWHVPVRSRYDLVALFSALHAIRARWEETKLSSAARKQECVSTRFTPSEPFDGHLWPERRMICATPPETRHELIHKIEHNNLHSSVGHGPINEPPISRQISTKPI